jgi:hypothetical protein
MHSSMFTQNRSAWCITQHHINYYYNSLHVLHITTGALDEPNDPNWAVKAGAPLTKAGQFLPKTYRFQTAPVFGASDALVSNTMQQIVCIVMLAYTLVARWLP